MAAEETSAEKYELQRLEQRDVVYTDEELGRGAYGYVVGLTVDGLRCAGKCLHDSFFNDVSPSDTQSALNVFKRECKQHAKLHHPNIVHCLGVLNKPGSNCPMLVMEYLPISLSRCLEKYTTMPSAMKHHILLGVSSGLAFLHSHQPPIVHRDLTANNVLLTESMQAKIADFGVSRVIATNQHIASLTKAPGTPAYMPPEALGPSPRYDKQLDIFSFGVLIIHVVLHVLPIPESPTRVDSKDRSKVIALSEIDRRADYIKKMDSEPVLRGLAIRCLQNDSEQRPVITDIIAELEGLIAKGEAVVPFMNTLEAAQLLKERQEAKDALLAKAKYLQSQLIAVLEDVQGTPNVSRQIKSAVGVANEMVGESSSLEDESRLVVTYKHPVNEHLKKFVKLSLYQESSECSLVLQPPVNMLFHGTYVKTMAVGFYKAWGVTLCEKSGRRRVFVVDNSGYDSLLSYDSDGSSSVLVKSAQKLQVVSPPEPTCWYPTEVAVMSENVLLVADSGNKRLMKLQLPEHPSGEISLVATTEDGLFQGPRYGTETPIGIGVSKQGTIFACDRENHQLIVLDSDLNLICKFGSKGKGRNQFQHPWGIAFDSQSNVYVSDCSNRCIKVFTRDLQPLRTIGENGPENLRAPTGICIDANDYLYVGDKGDNTEVNQRVYVYDPSGAFKMHFGSSGNGNGQFYKPLGLAADKDGHIYVADGEGGRVQVFA